MRLKRRSGRGKKNIYIIVVTLLLAAFIFSIGSQYLRPLVPTTDDVHSVWLKETDMTPANLKKLSDNDITLLMIETGHWNTGGTITSWISQSEATNYKNMATNVNQNFKLLAWIYPANAPCDLTSISQRQKFAHEAVSFLDTCTGFDGINDDLYDMQGIVGGFTSTTENQYAEFINLVNAARPNKIVTCAMYAGYGTNIQNLYGKVNIDYVCPMFYDNKAWGPDRPENPGGLNRINDVLSCSTSPVLLGIMVNNDEHSPVTLQESLNWITSHYYDSHQKYSGIALWRYDMFNLGGRQDWSAWWDFIN